MVTIHDCEQGSEEWHAAREGKYTGSNAAKLLKYGTRAYSKTERSDFTGNFWTRRGHLLETEAIELYERITGAPVHRAGFVTNDQYPDCLYSPDGLPEKTVLEVKCFDIPKHLRLLAGDIPLEVQAQIHFGMLICERRGGILLLYNPKLEPKQALGIIKVPYRASISANFKRILTKGAK